MGVQMAKRLSENQIRIILLFKDQWDRMGEEYGGWMYPTAGYYYPYAQRMDMNTVKSLRAKGLIEAERDAEDSGSTTYRITKEGLEAIIPKPAQPQQRAKAEK